MYYPKSQIKTNLYTNGVEYILSTTKSGYSGFYYQISTKRLCAESYIKEVNQTG